MTGTSQTMERGHAGMPCVVYIHVLVYSDMTQCTVCLCADAVMGRRLTEAGWDSAVDSVEFAATESELSGWSEPNGASEHVHEVEFSMAQLQALVDDQESDSEIDDLVADEDGISVSADAASANIFASNPTARRRLQQAGVGSGVSMLFSSLVAPAFSGGE